MGFVRYLKDGLRVLILEREASERLSADQDAFGAGLLIVLLAGLAQGIKALVMGLKWWALILDPLFMLLLFLVAIFLVNLAAFFLGGKSSFIRLFRAASCAFVAGWALLIPFLGTVVILWYLVALVVSVRWVHTIHPLRAFIAVAAPILLVIIVTSFVIGLTVLGGILAP